MSIFLKNINNCLLLNCIQTSHVTLNTSDVMVILHDSFQSHHNYMHSCTFIEFLYNCLLYHFVSFIPCYFVGGTFSSDLSPFVPLHSVSAAAHLWLQNLWMNLHENCCWRTLQIFLCKYNFNLETILTNTKHKLYVFLLIGVFICFLCACGLDYILCASMWNLCHWF